jgi:hypothetical protein
VKASLNPLQFVYRRPNGDVEVVKLEPKLEPKQELKQEAVLEGQLEISNG